MSRTGFSAALTTWAAAAWAASAVNDEGLAAAATAVVFPSALSAFDRLSSDADLFRDPDDEYDRSRDSL